MQANKTTRHLKDHLRGFIQGKTRITFAWLFIFGLVALATQPLDPIGIGMAFFGASLRFWASGFLRKDRRPAVGGPYAWVRNPLYVGTYLMAVGASWAVGHLAVLVGVSVVFAAIYHFIILDEETKLIGLFQESYQAYCESVPRFFPRLWPASREVLLHVNPVIDHHRFSWELAMQNKAYEAYVSFFGIFLLLALRQTLF